MQRYVPSIRTPGGLAIEIQAGTSYALDHHNGTPPHTITPVNKTVLRFVDRNGEVVFARRVRHSGTRPNRFLLDPLIREVTRLRGLTLRR